MCIANGAHHQYKLRYGTEDLFLRLNYISTFALMFLGCSGDVSHLYSFVLMFLCTDDVLRLYCTPLFVRLMFFSCPTPDLCLCFDSIVLHILICANEVPYWCYTFSLVLHTIYR